MKEGLCWQDGSTDELKVGLKVRCGQSVRQIRELYDQRLIPGGVMLDEAVEGCVSWNVDELVPLR